MEWEQPEQSEQIVLEKNLKINKKDIKRKERGAMQV